MIDLLNFDFCDMMIYDHYIVTTIKEGVNLTPHHNVVLVNVAETYFKDKPFVYITQRINSYSVNPAIYNETSKIKNLKGLAVVSKIHRAKINAKIEQMFFIKPFEVFTELEDAIKWAKQQTANPSSLHTDTHRE